MFSIRKSIDKPLKKPAEPKIIFNDMIDDIKSNNNTPMGPPIKSQQPNLSAEGVADNNQNYQNKKSDDFVNDIDLEIDNIFDCITNMPTSINDLNILTRKLSDGQKKTYEYLTEMNIENISKEKLLNIAKMFGNNTTGAINYLMFDDPDDSNIAEPDILTAIERSSKVNKNDLLINPKKSITLMGMNEHNNNINDNIDDDGDNLNINNKNVHTLMGYCDNMNNNDNKQENKQNMNDIKIINQQSVTLMGDAKGQINVCNTNIIQNNSVTLIGFCDANQKLNVNNQNKK
eukprot:3193_1